tara:strand:+ start:155 stop:322 length:168 start_codon:yes stop_codon:yes gene_type:complete
MTYQLTIIEKTKDGNDEWQLEEMAIEKYEDWDMALLIIKTLVSKGYLYELKIIEE